MNGMMFGTSLAGTPAFGEIAPRSAPPTPADYQQACLDYLFAVYQLSPLIELNDPLAIQAVQSRAEKIVALRPVMCSAIKHLKWTTPI